MDTVTLQISRAEAAKFLPLFESRRVELASELAALDAQIAAIKNKGTTSNGSFDKPTAKAKYGASSGRVISYLKSDAAAIGVNIRQIAKESGTSYGTAYRTIKQLAKDGKANETDGLWTLKDI